MASLQVGVIATHLRKDKRGVTGLRKSITLSRHRKFFIGKDVHNNDKVEILRLKQGFAYVKVVGRGVRGWVQAKHLNTPSSSKSSIAVRKHTLKREPRQVEKDKTTQSRQFTIVSYGTQKELLCLVKDPFGDKGVTVQKMLSQALDKIGVSKPMPSSRGDGTWKSWKEAGHLRVKGLKSMADKILLQIRREHPNVAHVMTKHRDYDCKDVNVYHRSGSKGRHADAQPLGLQNFVFSTGLSCNASAWPGAHGVDYRTGQTNGGWGGKQVSMKLESGDCWVMEGKTPHCIHNCIAGTSPPELGKWLADRRASILIRQKD